jgi:hypothetical protein
MTSDSGLGAESGAGKMRRRLIEILSAVVGVGLVAALWAYRNGTGPEWFPAAGTDSASTGAPGSVQVVPSVTPASTSSGSSPTTSSQIDSSQVDASSIQKGILSSSHLETTQRTVQSVTDASANPPATVDAAEVQAVTRELSSARAEIESVTAELEQLDVSFDALEAVYAEREERGEDMRQLDSQMMVQLEELVSEYQSLESVLAEARSAEALAAEELEKLRGRGSEESEQPEER